MTGNGQVFLCYARPDFSKALELYERLQTGGLRPWLDKKRLKPGDNWDSKIRAAIRTSRFFLVLLTKHSVSKSGYLQKEIKEALDIQDEQADAARYVIPVRLEDCEIPERLGHIQSADLFDRDGWENLLEILAEPADGEPNVRPRRSATDSVATRAPQLPVGGLPTPCFFPSISSAAKNSLSPIDHLKVLVQLRHPLFLISAYDIATCDKNEQKRIVRLLKRAAIQGQVVLMDSGLYEKKWLRVKNWPKSEFQRALRTFPFHLAFGYDNPNPPGNVGANVREIVGSIRNGRRLSNFRGLIPIVHSQTPRTLTEVCVRVAKELNPLVLAVPERELGESIRQCTIKIRELRRELGTRLGTYVPLHVLGTGNPLSILSYSWAGADSFDGLDWCQTVADQKTGRLHHSLQLDFFPDQSTFSGEISISYMTRVLGHNLDFYKNWMNLIQHHTKEDSVDEMLEKYLPRPFLEVIRQDASSK